MKATLHLLALVGCDAFALSSSRLAVVQPAAIASRVHVLLAAEGEKKSPTAEEVMEAYRAIDAPGGDAPADAVVEEKEEQTNFADVGCAYNLLHFTQR